MKHVFSTLACDNRYTEWKTNAGLNSIERSVLVRGGAGVAIKTLGPVGATPMGVRTEVSDADAEWLSKNGHFIEHQKRGFVKIVNVAQDPEKAAQSMSDEDKSRPKTADDVKKDAATEAAKSGLAPEETLNVATGAPKKK